MGPRRLSGWAWVAVVVAAAEASRPSHEEGSFPASPSESRAFAADAAGKFADAEGTAAVAAASCASSTPLG